MSIRSFRHKGLRRLFEHDDHGGVPPQSAPKLRDILAVLDSAATMEEIRGFPGWRLHPLTGDLGGLWSLTVTANRRIVFRFENCDASDVDLVDYH